MSNIPGNGSEGRGMVGGAVVGRVGGGRRGMVVMVWERGGGGKGERGEREGRKGESFGKVWERSFCEEKVSIVIFVLFCFVLFLGGRKKRGVVFLVWLKEKKKKEKKINKKKIDFQRK